MKRQRLRKFLLLLSFLLFPVTIYYLSPVLIINASNVVPASMPVPSKFCTTV